MKIESIRDIYIELGRELYSSSEQQLNSFREMEKQATSAELKRIIKRQLINAQNQQVRVREALKSINASPEGETCTATESILKRALERIQRSKDAGARDVSILSSLHYLNHYKISGFSSTSACAREIGQEQHARELQEAILEEEEMVTELNRLTEAGYMKLANTTIFA